MKKMKVYEIVDDGEQYIYVTPNELTDEMVREIVESQNGYKYDDEEYEHHVRWMYWSDVEDGLLVKTGEH